jgi:hypothetical protein
LPSCCLTDQTSWIRYTIDPSWVILNFFFYYSNCTIFLQQNIKIYIFFFWIFSVNEISLETAMYLWNFSTSFLFHKIQYFPMLQSCGIHTSTISTKKHCDSWNFFNWPFLTHFWVKIDQTFEFRDLFISTT